MRTAPALTAAATLAACGLGAGRAAPGPAGPALVDLREAAPRVEIDIRYATADNFTGKTLYPAGRCLLVREAAGSLAQVARDLEPAGLRLKVWDCYRPLSIQRKLWSLVPDPRYVADPDKGSRHNRAAAVDLTLIDEDGKELAMPTPYDDFTPKAHRAWTGATKEAKRNRALLEAAMERRGFRGLATEWWHFDHESWRGRPLLDEPLVR